MIPRLRLGILTRPRLRLKTRLGVGLTVAINIPVTVITVALNKTHLEVGEIQVCPS